MVGRVFVLSGPHTGKKIFVLDRLNVYEVGKASGSHIKLHDDSVAMNQCRFYKKGEEYTVYALSEQSATMVNGAPAKKRVLASGDVVKIGATELLFELVERDLAEIPPVITARPPCAAAAPAPQDGETPPPESDAAAEAGLPPRARASATKLVPALGGQEPVAAAPNPASADTARAQTAAGAVRARILVLDGERRGQEFSLEGKDQFKIGRSTSSDVRLPDAKVSRHHCLIESARGEFVIIDLESANGTIVNGEKIAKATLKNGDFLRLGFTMLKFEVAGA